MINKILFCASFFFATSLMSFTYGQATSIKWMSFTEAYEASAQAAESEKKKVLVDVYTDWCGWCKRMDQTTFSDSDVAAYINKHYYPVKLNAEKEGPIVLGDSTYEIKKDLGRNGTHSLAVQLLQGKMSYPSIVYLDEHFNMLSPVPGYQTPEQIEPILRFFGDNAFLDKKWEDYQSGFIGTFGKK